MSMPLVSTAECKRIILVCLDSGEVFFSDPHAYDRMKKHAMTKADAVATLRTGAVREGEWENGAWRYQVSTYRLVVVIQLESETELLVVTCWRKS